MYQPLRIAIPYRNHNRNCLDRSVQFIVTKVNKQFMHECLHLTTVLQLQTDYTSGARLYVWSPQKLKILLEMQSKFPVIFGITNNIGQRAKQYACPNIFIGGQMPRLLHWIDTCVSRLYMAQTLF